MEAPERSTPPAQQVPSDDCELNIRGTIYHPHVGEWIEIVPHISVQDLRMQAEWDEMQVQLKALEGDEDEDEKAGPLIRQAYDSIIAVVAPRLMGWTWSDHRGHPLPPPSPAILITLHLQELQYLTRAVRGDTMQASRDDTPPSPTTSSDTPPRRDRRKSSGGRSRTPA